MQPLQPLLSWSGYLPARKNLRFFSNEHFCYALKFNTNYKPL